MERPSAGSSCEIHPEMELEDVFLHFLDRFEGLPTPRSVAEATITTDEFSALKTWFSARWGWPRMWCEDTWQIGLSKELSASRQEMFGALILILASEVCRDNSGEDAVWPAVTAVLKADRISFPVLFVGGQPTPACKKALAAGARRVKLRNLIDRYGAQEYFDTLKLQFGFTIKGAVRRLPEWLDGLGLPIAVRILAGVETEFGDLRSTSFSQLWGTLQDFRHNRVSEDYTSAILRASPWIRSDWTPELLRVVRLRLTRPPTSLGGIGSVEHSSDPICEPILRWEEASKPRLMIRLNEEQIREMLAHVNTATFAIDGRVVDRWIAEEGGLWRGKRELPCEPEGAKPNLRPKLLSISTNGQPIEEIDLLEMSFGHPLLIFDLKTREFLSPASTLDCNRSYGLICDPDLSISEASHCLKLKDRSAYQLNSPWSKDLKVTCEGALYWKPKIDDTERLQPVRVILESPLGEVAEIGAPANVCVRGAPDDATAVSLLAGRSVHSLIKDDQLWKTGRPVQITIGMCSGEERLRVRVTGDGYARTVVPKLSLNLRGIACVEADTNTDTEPRWQLLNRKQPLDRADGCGRARVFVETRPSQLYEGAHLVTAISSRTLPLRDLYGWGAPLIVRSSGSSSSVLIDSVEDYGLGRFLPSLFGRPTGAWIYWRSPMPPSNEHQILVWSDILQEPQVFGVDAILSQQNGATWKLPSLASIAAMAVTYQGARISAYWTPQAIIRALRYRPSAKIFGLCRWLKLPVLNASFRGPIRDAVLFAPAEFVRGWLSDDLQYGLVHRPAEQGLETVVREFFWDYTDRDEAKMDKLVHAFPRSPTQPGSQSESEAFKSTLMHLGEICPSLAYRLAKHKVRGDKYRRYVRAVTGALLRQPETTDSQQMRSQLIAACRDCANLLGSTPEMLETSVQALGSQLDGHTPNYREPEDGLRKLGETSRGRQFISASLLFRLVERTGF